MTRPTLIEGPSNRPLLDALAAGTSLAGHVLVRPDGSVVPAADAREADWLSLQRQLGTEPVGPGAVTLVDGEDVPPA